MTFKFYISVAKKLKLKVRKFCGLGPTLQKLRGKNSQEGDFLTPRPTILNWVKYMAVNKNTKFFFAPLPFGHPYLFEIRTYKNVSEKMIGDMIIEEKMDMLRKENKLVLMDGSLCALRSVLLFCCNLRFIINSVQTTDYRRVILIEDCILRSKISS